MPKPQRKTGRRTGRGRPVPGLAQMRALSHPLRIRLLELFGERPRTTKQAAQQMRTAPTPLYHHVAALERAGLVRVRETRQNRGTIEKYYELVRHRMGGDPRVVAALKNKRGRRDLAALSFVVFDLARNEVLEAIARGSGKIPQGLIAMRASLHLSKAGARKVQKDLLRIIRSRKARPGPGRRFGRRRRYSLTVALTPLAD